MSHAHSGDLWAVKYLLVPLSSRSYAYITIGIAGFDRWRSLPEVIVEIDSVILNTAKIERCSRKCPSIDRYESIALTAKIAI
jgi:hypothetical protein